MHTKTFLRTLSVLLLLWQVLPAKAQQQPEEPGREIVKELYSGGRSINIGDSVFILLGICKNNFANRCHFIKSEFVSAPVAKPAEEKKADPFIKIHGNVLYNFSYRSYLDTPFAETDIMQHLVQTNLNFLLKGKYPVRMIISNRSSNSPYFRDATDVSLQFNRYQLLDSIKEDLRRKAEKMVDVKRLNALEQTYKNKLAAAQQMREWLSNPARMQEMIEEKEKQMRRSATEKLQPAATTEKIKETFPEAGEAEATFSKAQKIKGGIARFEDLRISDVLNDQKKKFTDSASAMAKDTLQALTAKIKDSSTEDKIKAKKKELQQLESEIKKDADKVKAEKKHVADSIAQIKREINSLNSGAGLYAFMKRNNMSKDSLTKGQRLLLSVNKIGIGRNWIDYSELTVKNVSLTGVNIEMNPAPYYVAVAAGKLNYRYRDFILKNNKTLPNQSLFLLRAGLGQKEKSNLIFTFYNGKKEVLNNISPGAASLSQRVLGVAVETRVALDANNYITAEVAKSSYGDNGVPQPAPAGLLRKALNVKTNTNMAYNLQLFSQYPATNTRITGYYRKTGKNFQSFNLYPTGSVQEAWMAKVNQSFWKRKLTVDAAVRKNDFVSPLAAATFNSKTVFKSLQAALRIPKYPFVFIGYYPSSQLSLSNGNVLTESQYNTLNATVSHNYRIKKIAMNTNAAFTKFYNSSTDTGFIYFNASSYTINHSIFLSPVQLQTSLGLTKQKNLNLLVLEQLVSCRVKNILTLSGSLKWNKLNNTENLFGGTAGAGLYLKKFGTLQFNYDKTYLPGYYRKLIPVDIGRMSFYREF
jgi:hypothetical protein